MLSAGDSSFTRRLSVAPRGRAAFALIDCIVATVLLGIALAVMIGLASNALNSQQTGERMATAAMLADEQLQLVLARGPDGYAQKYSASGTCDAPFTDYSYKLAFSGGQSAGDPHQIKCTISWTASGSERNISIETLIASRIGSEETDPDPIRTPKTGIVRTP